ncbi:MAG TPA: hypothetical protein VEL76_06845 [Gemmataceae bacterium]|nr:hypothetical protein [Gemmataceae bacterium]
MRIKLVLLAAVLTLIPMGCATTFRAGGRNGGVETGAVIAPPPPVVLQDSSPIAPLPLQ